MKRALQIASVASMIDLFNRDNIELLGNLGYKVDVAANFEEGSITSQERVDQYKKELNSNGIDVYHVDIPRSIFKIKNIISSYKMVKKLAETNYYDIVHCHSPIGGVITRLACKKARRKGTRVIYTAHGFHFYKGASFVNWLIYYPIEKWMSKYTDTLITINNEDYAIAQKKFKSKNVELVNGIGVSEKKFNFEMTDEEKYELRKSIGVNNNDILLIYVAEISKRKNQEMLVNAMRKIVDENEKVKLLLVGKDSLNEKIHKLVEELELKNNVLFLGFRNDIPNLMKISDVLVSTSKQEGLPVNVMEGMFVGLPMVLTNCRGNRDLIQNEAQRLVEIGDIEAFKDAVIKEWSEVNYNLEKYTCTSVREEMNKIYQNVTK